jgi:hypothetical protein
MVSFSLSTNVVWEYLIADVSSLVQIVKEKERFRKAPPNYAMKKTQLLKEKVRFTLSRTGEMAQPVKAPTSLLKVMSSNPSNHMVAHNHP